MIFDEFCERLRHLRRDRSGGVAKPYKPLLLAAVVILVQKGKIRSRNVLLDGGLRSGFRQLLDALYPGWRFDAKPEYPFRHLETDGVWRLVPLEGASDALRAARDAKLEAWDVLRHVACAQLDEGVFQRLATRFEDRVRVLQILWEVYFPPDAALKLMRFMVGGEAPAAAQGGATTSASARSRSTSRRTGTRRPSRRWASSLPGPRSTGSRGARYSHR
jgi:hypothetical protein